MSKYDVMTLKRGLKRLTVALLTTVGFALSAAGLIVTATVPGYLAVVLFLASVMVLGISITMLYAQGINRRTYTESKGERK